jgi:hypothetical protein
VALRPVRASIDLESVVIVYVIIVALCAAVDRVAAEGLRELLGARVVRVVRADQDGELVVAEAGQAGRDDLDAAGLPQLNEEGRLPAGHWRAVGGTLVLPAQGVVVDLVRGRRRVGALVVVPEEDRPLLRPTRMAIAATAHVLALAGSAHTSR